jgi:hypothetical protein
MKIIPFLARLHYGIALFVGFIAGMVAGSITFHYVKVSNRNNIIAWILGLFSGFLIGAVAGYILGDMIGINILAGILMGAIGGTIGAVVGILH